MSDPAQLKASPSPPSLPVAPRGMPKSSSSVPPVSFASSAGRLPRAPMAPSARSPVAHVSPTDTDEAETKPLDSPKVSVILRRASCTRPSPAAFPVGEIYPVPKANASKCHIYSEEVYRQMYRRSVEEPETFWRHYAMSELRWIHPFTRVCNSTRLDDSGANCWFLNGKLNVCDNCIDRWAESSPNRVAIIWEGDEQGESLSFTYGECLSRVCRMANLLKRLGVRKFDTVGIYMPVIPDAVFAMLACARIGAVHVFVFAGFSAPNLRERLIDAHCRFLVTADIGSRGGKPIYLKSIVNLALTACPIVERVLVFRRPSEMLPPSTDVNSPLYVHMEPGRDVWGADMLANERPYCPAETMDSEDALFLLHTSGSTGKPKGILHTTAGYLLYTAITHKFIFDYHAGDIYSCVADIGWITGHSYTVYGPLCNGGTTVLFESMPTYPADGSRYWSFIERHRINQFYTSPTAIRSLMGFGDAIVNKYDLSSLRIIGTVGEPINAEAWRWLHNVVGKGRCSIVDTYWQTETGGICVTPLPGAFKTKPGSATLPFFGINAVLVDPLTGQEIEGNNAHGMLCIKQAWPGMLRTIYGDHLRLMCGYLDPYPGYFYTGDGAYRDKDGYYWMKGRLDDVLNVAGHRFASAEIENALARHPDVEEAAVVAIPHKIKGSGMCCVVVLKATATSKISSDFERIMSQLKQTVRSEIGPIATPDCIYIVSALPKTRSGKIMRRIIRKIVHGETSPEELGDLSTLAEPTVVEDIIRVVRECLP